MNVYRVEVNLSRAVFVRAKSAAEAHKKVLGLKGGIVNYSSPEITVSAVDPSSPKLPEISLSPAGVCLGPAGPFEPDLVHRGEV